MGNFRINAPKYYWIECKIEYTMYYYVAMIEFHNVRKHWKSKWEGEYIQQDCFLDWNFGQISDSVTNYKFLSILTQKCNYLLSANHMLCVPNCFGYGSSMRNFSINASNNYWIDMQN